MGSEMCIRDRVQDVAEMVWAQIKANDAAIKANKAAAETPEEAEA